MLFQFIYIYIYIYIYSDYINKWHGIRQTILSEYVYESTIYTKSITILLLNSVLTRISRICKGLQQKGTTGVKFYKTSRKFQI